MEAGSRKDLFEYQQVRLSGSPHTLNIYYTFLVDLLLGPAGGGNREPIVEDRTSRDDRPRRLREPNGCGRETANHIDQRFFLGRILETFEGSSNRL